MLLILVPMMDIGHVSMLMLSAGHLLPKGTQNARIGA